MSVDMRSRVLFRDVLGEDAPMPDWLPRSHAIFCKSLLHRKYPCYWGTAAEEQGDLLMTYVDGEDRDHLPTTLATFLEIATAHPDRQHVMALFFSPATEPRELAFYKAKFWELLQFLHDHDPHPWPDRIPPDPEDPNWEFSFTGVPMFIFEAAPAYAQRRSRNLGPGMVVLFQPRIVFSEIEGNTPAGVKTRRIIRQRLRKWDQMEPHPDLGSYGDSQSREWKQYFLPDDTTAAQGQCPLHIRREAVPSEVIVASTHSGEESGDEHHLAD